MANGRISIRREAFVTTSPKQNSPRNRHKREPNRSVVESGYAPDSKIIQNRRCIAFSFFALHFSIPLDQAVRGTVVLERRRCLALKLGNDSLS